MRFFACLCAAALARVSARRLRHATTDGTPLGLLEEVALYNVINNP